MVALTLAYVCGVVRPSNPKRRIVAMKEIIQSYRQAEAQVNALLGDGRNCPNLDTSRKMRMVVAGWQQWVAAQLDDMSALRFEGVAAPLATPLSWNSFSEEGASAFTAFQTMKKQVQWLADTKLVKLRSLSRVITTKL